MDDQETPLAGGRIIRRIPGPRPGDDLPDGFAPLRLNMTTGALSIELSGPVLLLGRHSSADIRIPLPDVSRRHCRFIFADGSWDVVDLNSLNGIYINGVRLHSAVLATGDVLRVGGLSFEVEIVGATPRADDAPRGPATTAAVLESIARALPADPAATQEYRRAS
jgi:pSer/pThr/pTyr-binding forkhead associated (FHA) protein